MEDGGTFWGKAELSMGFTGNAFIHFHQALNASCTPFVLTELKKIYERDRLYSLSHIGKHSYDRMVQKHGSLEEYEGLLKKLGLDPFPMDLLLSKTTNIPERKELML